MPKLGLDLDMLVVGGPFSGVLPATGVTEELTTEDAENLTTEDSENLTTEG